MVRLPPSRLGISQLTVVRPRVHLAVVREPAQPRHAQPQRLRQRLRRLQLRQPVRLRPLLAVLQVERVRAPRLLPVHARAQVVDVRGAPRLPRQALQRAALGGLGLLLLLPGRLLLLGEPARRPRARARAPWPSSCGLDPRFLAAGLLNRLPAGERAPAPRAGGPRAGPPRWPRRGAGAGAGTTTGAAAGTNVSSFAVIDGTSDGRGGSGGGGRRERSREAWNPPPAHLGHGSLTGSPRYGALGRLGKRRLRRWLSSPGGRGPRAEERAKNRLPCGECPALHPERRNAAPALEALKADAFRTSLDHSRYLARLPCFVASTLPGPAPRPSSRPVPRGGRAVE